MELEDAIKKRINYCIKKKKPRKQKAFKVKKNNKGGYLAQVAGIVTHTTKKTHTCTQRKKSVIYTTQKVKSSTEKF